MLLIFYSIIHAESFFSLLMFVHDYDEFVLLQCTMALLSVRFSPKIFVNIKYEKEKSKEKRNSTSQDHDNNVDAQKNE
jgi:hypothetical protein